MPLKNYHDEARAIKDISKFLENPVVLFKAKGSTWKDIAREMLENLQVRLPYIMSLCKVIIISINSIICRLGVSQEI